MLSRLAAAALLAVVSANAGAAEPFRIEGVRAALAVDLAALKPGTILFSDHKGDPRADPETGFMRFADWTGSQPLQKQVLGLFPGYGDGPAMSATADGDDSTQRPLRDRLYMYVVEARFLLNKPASAIDIARYANLPFVQRMDPAIKHHAIGPGDTIPGKIAEYAVNRHPERTWCTGPGMPICIQSHYKFEGKLPTGIMLANKLTDTAKKIPDFIEFQSELRRLMPDDLAHPALVDFARLPTPVAAGLEQSTFYVNQILQFGKFLALVQPHPADPGQSVATVAMALAVKASVFERKKEYERVPVLRNLVPAQVLLGNSSFNTGDSISAGLPKYTRNRIAAIAGILGNE